ncbi:5'/3'-nucleotidase SurE [Sphingomicrobium astaxanthinifaciens]|uniref:5'/3'-nucleotidase SurE n=1 Tax=Sphingomicrobium astaxanthinifaciens TaxID=1227949 RepID=UPI001FCA93B2|nr:5'/3'-nucleotidase SurE [Sphingomicrobium astaxanthinifaciens]MCJ7420316.1 5'/3'-nucleotidase SurE [Sphingomicrobium astaxanthinifaciens]
MRILLTNDDGIHAPGLALLERLAAPLAEELWLVAPAEEASGAGHSLTLTRPLRIRKHGPRRFSVTGTPTDAVMLALGHLMKEARPDVILSGVNRGANLGEDVTYSGTVSAAMEGALAGVPAIALGQCSAAPGTRDGVRWEAAEARGGEVLARLVGTPMPARSLVNVNFPPLAAEEVRGIKVCRQGFRDYSRLKIVERTDPRGFRYYWFGTGETVETPGHRTDLEVIADGFVAVTPLHLDLTGDEQLAALGARFA